MPIQPVDFGGASAGFTAGGDPSLGIDPTVMRYLKMKQDEEDEQRRQMGEARVQNMQDAGMAGVARGLAQTGQVFGKAPSAEPYVDTLQQIGRERTALAQESAPTGGLDSKVMSYLMQKKMQEKPVTDAISSRLGEQGTYLTESGKDTGIKAYQKPERPEKPEKPEKTLASKVEESTAVDLAKKNASIKTNTNLMRSQLKQFQSATDPGMKEQIGNSMLKTLNSLISADAIGEGEASRLGAFLQNKMFNMTGPGSMFGRDLGEFDKQAQALITSADDAYKLNENELNKLTGAGVQNRVVGPTFGPKAGGPGQAVAAPGKKDPADMTEEELMQELGR